MTFGAACSTLARTPLPQPPQRHSAPTAAALGRSPSGVVVCCCMAASSACRDTSVSGSSGSGSTGCSGSRGVKPISMQHASVGIAAATFAAQWQLRRRQRAPLSSRSLCRRRRSSSSRKQAQCLVDATALPLSAPPQQQELEPVALPAASRVTIRPAEPADYWAIAEVHCMAFYPREPPGLMHMLLRLDRVLALAAGMRASAKSEHRRFRCLVACQQPQQTPRSSSGSNRSSAGAGSNDGSTGSGSTSISTGSNRSSRISSGSSGSTDDGWQAAFLRQYWAFWRAAIPGPVTAGLGADFGELGIVGAAVVDTLGDHTPPKRTPGGGKRRRLRLAYVSNVAVSAAARRRGIGAALLQQSEQVAAEWTATAIMLHVDGGNDAAMALYRQQQYRLLAEPRRSWLAKATDVHAGKRMMMKRLPGVVGVGSSRHPAAQKTQSAHKNISSHGTDGVNGGGGSYFPDES